mmetsp:Transcript_9731/g.11114  ORF Transcript_9731/g.11114 Transcript_9731/m.11114 type:complete len:207 (+) Transcript_9731:1532-2152(+)
MHQTKNSTRIPRPKSNLCWENRTYDSHTSRAGNTTPLPLKRPLNNIILASSRGVVVTMDVWVTEYRPMNSVPVSLDFFRMNRTRPRCGVPIRLWKLRLVHPALSFGLDPVTFIIWVSTKPTPMLSCVPPCWLNWHTTATLSHTWMPVVRVLPYRRKTLSLFYGVRDRTANWVSVPKNHQRNPISVRLWIVVVSRHWRVDMATPITS